MKYNYYLYVAGASVACLSLAIVAAAGHQEPSSSALTQKANGQVKVSSASKVGVRESIEHERLRKNWADEFRLAKIAYQSGDYTTAIVHLQHMKQLGELATVPSIYLACIYSKLGKDSDTYKELHAVLYPSISSISSYQNEPRVSLYYADLCRKLGLEGEAKKAYIYACNVGAKFGGPPGVQDQLAMIKTKDLDMDQLRSAAIAASAMTLTGENPSLANRYAEASVALDRNSCVARLVYSHTLYRLEGRSELAKMQAFEAQHLSDNERIRSEIENYRNSTKLGYELKQTTDPTNGQSRVALEPYKYSGFVSTPKMPADFAPALPDYFVTG